MKRRGRRRAIAESATSTRRLVKAGGSTPPRTCSSTMPMEPPMMLPKLARPMLRANVVPSAPTGQTCKAKSQVSSSLKPKSTQVRPSLNQRKSQSSQVVVPTAPTDWMKVRARVGVRFRVRVTVSAPWPRARTYACTYGHAHLGREHVHRDGVDATDQRREALDTEREHVVRHFPAVGLEPKTGERAVSTVELRRGGQLRGLGQL